jgi:hypothetical protein
MLAARMLGRLTAHVIKAPVALLLEQSLNVLRVHRAEMPLWQRLSLFRGL